MTSPQAPLLSVAVLNYNYARYLPQCLDSILGQSFRDFEVIAIDDCSTDESIEVIQPYLADPRLRLIRHEQNRGFAASLIEGTEEHPRGELRMVISADDLVRDEHAFERQVGMLTSAPEGMFCFSACTRLLPDGSEDLYQPLPQDAVFEPGQALRLFLEGCWVLHSGSMFRADAYFAAGGYRRDISMPLDLQLCLSLAMQGQTLYCATPLYAYRVHAGQMSSTNMRLSNREVVRVFETACKEGVRRGLIPAGMQGRALRAHLSGAILGDAEHGSQRQAASRMSSWLAVAPVETLRSSGFWVGLVRLGLGRRGYQLLRRAKASLLRARSPLSVS
jgi:hypothetical protein